MIHINMMMNNSNNSFDQQQKQTMELKDQIVNLNKLYLNQIQEYKKTCKELKNTMMIKNVYNEKLILLIMDCYQLKIKNASRQYDIQRISVQLNENTSNSSNTTTIQDCIQLENKIQQLSTLFEKDTFHFNSEYQNIMNLKLSINQLLSSILNNNENDTTTMATTNNDNEDGGYNNYEMVSPENNINNQILDEIDLTIDQTNNLKVENEQLGLQCKKENELFKNKCKYLKKKLQEELDATSTTTTATS